MKQVKNHINGAHWIVLVDFNAIGSSNEKLGSEKVDKTAVTEFNQLIEDLDLEEYGQRLILYMGVMEELSQK